MKTFVDYKKIDTFQVMQITRFLWHIRLNLIYDFKNINSVYKITNKKSKQPTLAKKFRLLIDVLDFELNQIKKIHWDKKEFQHLYFYFPN